MNIDPKEGIPGKVDGAFDLFSLCSVNDKKKKKRFEFSIKLSGKNAQNLRIRPDFILKDFLCVFLSQFFFCCHCKVSK